MGSQIYTALASGTRLLQQMDVVANNLANVNTTGFKGDRPTFKVVRPPRYDAAPLSPAESRLATSWQIMDGARTDFSQGHLRGTGNPTDLAVSGEGFFAVEGEDGETLLTRDGAFRLDREGYLSARDGARLLDDKGQSIQVGKGLLEIRADGEIRVDGSRKATVGVYDVTDRALLSKAGGNRWAVADPSSLMAARGEILTEHLEASNVEPVRALTDLVALSRYYEAFQKTVETADEIDQKLNNAVGKIDQ